MEAVETILLIDDDEANHFVMKQLLKKTKLSSQVLSARNGLEGLKTLLELANNQQKLPEIILLDLNMPIMNGFEFMEALAHQKLNLSQSKIYMLTSSFHPQDRQKAASYPLAGYLNKPLTPEKLAALIM